MFCTSCQQASLRADWKPILVPDVVESDPPRECPYSGCHNRLSNTVPWHRMRRWHLELPEQPEPDTVYNYTVIIKF